MKSKRPRQFLSVQKINALNAYITMASLKSDSFCRLFFVKGFPRCQIIENIKQFETREGMHFYCFYECPSNHEQFQIKEIMMLSQLIKTLRA